MKKVLRIILWIYGFVANLITYITGIELVINKLKVHMPEWASYLIIAINALLFIFLLFYLSFLLMICVTLPYRKRIGTHEIACKPFNMFIYRIINNNRKLLKVVHSELYHHFYRLKYDIRKGRVSDSEQLQEKMAEFLKSVGLSLKEAFNLSVSINVKSLSYSPDKTLFLSPYIQIQQERDRSSVHEERNLTYKYVILLDKQAGLQRACDDAKHYNEHDDKRIYHVNSIFNYLMNSTERYWMSNDLAKDKERNLFYTSSGNYPTHYKSMAVFKIMPPGKDTLPEGVLIFDTADVGRFAEKECSQLMGYIAHLLYELFSEYQDYEQKKKTERQENATVATLQRRGRNFKRT